MMMRLSTSVELEGRRGYRFGVRADRRAAGVFAVLARLGRDISHREHTPMPQLGLFIGFLLH